MSLSNADIVILTLASVLIFLSVWYINVRSKKKYQYLNKYQKSVIYQVHNKVFSIYVWTRKDAEAFLSNHTGSSGLTISEIDVFGERP